MAKKRNENSYTKYLTGARSSVRRRVEISPEAYELLRKASIPSEFKEVVREVIPNVAMLYPPDLESRATSSEIDMTFIEMPILRVSIPPVEMSVPSVPVSWPEMSTADRVVNTFHLTDLTLDLSGVAHMTPDLHDLALSTLSPIVLNLPALWGTGQLYFFQDGPPPDGEEEEDDDVAEPPKTCDAEFVSERRNRDWYRNNGFGEKLACPKTRTKTTRELNPFASTGLSPGRNGRKPRCARNSRRREFGFRAIAFRCVSRKCPCSKTSPASSVSL